MTKSFEQPHPSFSAFSCWLEWWGLLWPSSFFSSERNMVSYDIFGPTGTDAAVLRGMLDDGTLTPADFWTAMAIEASKDEDFARRTADLWIDTLEDMAEERAWERAVA